MKNIFVYILILFVVLKSKSQVSQSSDGRVTIGAVLPKAKLHVDGDIYVPLGKKIGYNILTDRFIENTDYIGHYSLGWYPTTNGGRAVLSAWDGIQLYTKGISRLKVDINGYIGVGTSTPTAQLHLHTQTGVIPFKVTTSSGVKPFMVHDNGGVSIGSHQVPAARSLLVDNTISIGTTESPKARLTTKIGWGDWMRFDNDLKEGYWAFHNNQAQKDFQIYHVKKDGTVVWPFKISDNGVIETVAIGINTSNTAGHQLAVAGSIVAERIYCKLQANWPDFVFTDKYKLISLDDVECFINENQHLPGVPSASKVKAEDGINLGEMNAVLLQKIEELTLYLIEQNKKIAVMQQEINSLK